MTNAPPGSQYSGAAIDDTHLIESFDQSGGNPGFEVFTGVPEPSSLCVVARAGLALLTRRTER